MSDLPLDQHFDFNENDGEIKISILRNSIVTVLSSYLVVFLTHYKSIKKIKIYLFKVDTN